MIKEERDYSDINVTIDTDISLIGLSLCLVKHLYDKKNIRTVDDLITKTASALKIPNKIGNNTIA